MESFRQALLHYSRSRESPCSALHLQLPAVLSLETYYYRSPETNPTYLGSYRCSELKRE